MAADKAGGYDYELVCTSGQERYVCWICHNLLREPTLTSCCGQHYCWACLQTWLEQRGHKTCPQCRGEFNYIVNQERKRDVLDLQVKCTYSTLGCRFKGKLRNMDDHVVSCSNTEIKCKLNCKEKIKHVDHEKHVKEDCRNREYTCKFCQYKSTYSKITGETVMTPRNTPTCAKIPAEKGHYAKCPDYPKTCPNECGTTTERKLMKAHRATCPEEIVKCRNFLTIYYTDGDGTSTETVECGKFMKRKFLSIHQQYQCLYREYTCQFCGLEKTYKEITGETVLRKYPSPVLNPPPEIGHYAVCPKYPITCCNECGTTTERNYMRKHRAICPREKVMCGNRGRGTNRWWPGNCGEVMERRLVAHHKQYECLYRSYTCQFCTLESTYIHITGETKMKKYDPSSVPNSEHDAIPNTPPERGHYALCSYYPKPCPNNCGKLIERIHMPEHHKHCSKENVTCNLMIEQLTKGNRAIQYRCNKVMERQYLPTHCQYECLYRKYTCQFCNLESTYTEVTGETEMKKYNPSSVLNTEHDAILNPPPERGHYAQCEKYPMHCPNQCREEVILREDMSSHRQQCPLEPVECPFREAGCQVKLVRKELEGHVTTEHLTGLLQAFMETKKELMETKKELAETQARLPRKKK